MSNPTRKINCDEAVGLLFEYLDNELERHDHATVEAHLQECRACFSRLEFDKRLRRMLKGSEAVSLPEALRARIKKIAGRF